MLAQTNGGSACNVFWQAGSSLGTTTAFAGNILALASITLNTGAVAPGRALARTGAVTLDTNGVGGCSSPGGGGTIQPGAALTPTLSQWALIALTLLIAAVGFIAMRRRDS